MNQGLVRDQRSWQKMTPNQNYSMPRISNPSLLSRIELHSYRHFTAEELLPSTNPTDCSWRFRVDSWRYNRWLSYSFYSIDSDLCNCFTPVSYLIMPLSLPSFFPSLASSFNPCLSHLSLQYSTSPIKIMRPPPLSFAPPVYTLLQCRTKKKTAKGNSNVKCKHANLRPNH